MMSDHLAQRVDPRALLTAAKLPPLHKSPAHGIAHLTVMTCAALVGLTAFGTLVVLANDDNGALAFVRQQTRPIRAAQPAYAPAPSAAYYAPRGFFPTAQPVRRTATASQQPFRAPIVASYAPFSAFYPSEQISSLSEPRRKAKRHQEGPSTVSLPAPPRYSRTPSGISAGGRQAYCVRTCDGFFFPISSSAGDRSDEAACNRLCPTAETKVYIGRIGTDIDDARARDTGRVYASLSTAFSYRKSVDKTCSCSATGFGVGQALPIERDGLLRAGDIVMTKTGMKVFNGNGSPARSANFTAVSHSKILDAKTRQWLHSTEMASMPGRSGLSAKDGPRKKSNEVQELRAATRFLETPTSLVRYVGPDRSTLR